MFPAAPSSAEMLVVVALLAATLGVAAPVHAAEPQAGSGEKSSSVASADSGDAAVEEVQTCMKRNLPTRSSRQKISLRSDGPGGTRTIEAELFWKPDEEGHSRFLVRVGAPADLRDTAVLMLEREQGDPDLFTYLPELRSTRRITGRAMSGSLFGTDFSYEDFQQLQSIAHRASMQRLPDAELEGRPVQVLAGEPAADSGSAYRRVVSYVDRESCAVLKIEFFAAGETPEKVLVAPWESVRREDGRAVPHDLVLTDPARGSETRLQVLQTEIDLDLPERFFSQTELTKGR